MTSALIQSYTIARKELIRSWIPLSNCASLIISSSIVTYILFCRLNDNFPETEISNDSDELFLAINVIEININ